MIESTQRWLGLDPGLAKLGWAILDPPDEERGERGKSGAIATSPLPILIEYGIIATAKSRSTAERLVELERDLIAIVQEFQPARIAVEMPFFGRQIKAAGGVLQAVGIINLVCCREAKITPVFFHQSSWKAHLGNGRADKSEVAMTIQNLFELDEMPADDASDAIAIGYAGFCGLINNIG